jgi:hypothetical protein
VGHARRGHRDTPTGGGERQRQEERNGNVTPAPPVQGSRTSDAKDQHEVVVEPRWIELRLGKAQHGERHEGREWRAENAPRCQEERCRYGQEAHEPEGLEGQVGEAEELDERSVDTEDDHAEVSVVGLEHPADRPGLQQELPVIASEVRTARHLHHRDEHEQKDQAERDLDRVVHG